MDKKQIACGVPWCIGLVAGGRQYCSVHQNANTRTTLPPAVTRELELRYQEAMRSTARDADARH